MRAILQFILIVACCVNVNAAIDTEVAFRATVQDVGLLGNFSGTVIPVHHDPRFAVSLKIEACSPEIEVIPKGEIVVFAIHSPTHLFSTEDPKGKQFQFCIRKETSDGHVCYRDLHLETRKPKQPTSPMPDVSAVSQTDESAK